jgi:glycosyltransferase 2 family protein
MKNLREFAWPLIGLTAVVVSGYLLYRELRHISLIEVWASLAAIPVHRYLLAAGSTLVAYAALAWYDRIALLHLGVRHISWVFVSICSFTTYALSHNIGASVFSGALVRYRAYTSKGLSAAQVAVLVALCSFTFGLGTILLGGVVLTLDPSLLSRLEGMLPSALTSPTSARVLGIALLAFVALYVFGSILHLRPITIRAFKLEYPRPAVMARQLLAAPLELLGAAGIIYFALPEAGNPGFLAVLAVFLAAFSAGLASHAPGALGVFELIFLTAMPDVAKPSVLAALLIFRLFYLLIPFAISIAVVLLYERARLAQAWRERMATQPPVS